MDRWVTPPNWVTSPIWGPGGEGGGVLLFMGYIGMRHCEGYGYGI